MADPVTLLPMQTVAAKLGIPETALELYGRAKAKIDLGRIDGLANRPMGKLVLVTAINPTPAGEGKTTTTIGLGDALNRLGKRTAIVLREPSLGPCFGQKGGATGGGKAQIAPADDINLHFNGDFHAITSAHNLLAAMIDNHLQWGGEPKLDPARISWPRVMDMNDRALRFITIGKGGKAHGVPRDTRFDITPASEVMAILCLARDLRDLKRRLGEAVVAETADGKPIRAADFQAVGAMAALLRDAIKPNLVQTHEGNPVLVHGGPFANIAHGCNSVIATTAGLRLADITVTEAGFGADLGAEKFLDIKCRQAGIAPAAAVIVATVRALKLHGGADPKQLATEDLAALGRGIGNLARHIENLGKFGLPVIVAVNRFASDTTAEIGAVSELASKLGARLAVAEHFARGGEGAEPLARAVLAAIEGPPATLKFLYPDAMPLADKIATIAREIYRAADTTVSEEARLRLKSFEAAGYGKLPVCIAKTQYSFSTDAKAVGAPTGHTLHVREARLSAGAGFVVAVCGDILTMPGLPRVPSAVRIDVDDAGQIHGLT